MASQRATVDRIVEQAAGAGDVSARPMFGEFGLYCDGKFVGSVCDDTLFVKVTAAGERLGGDLERASPYPGAKPHLLVPAERIADGRWLASLIRTTTKALPKRK